jgi:hypothetical protein
MVISMLLQLLLPRLRSADPKAPPLREDIALRPQLATVPPKDMPRAGRKMLLRTKKMAAQSSKTKAGAKRQGQQ